MGVEGNEAFVVFSQSRPSAVAGLLTHPIPLPPSLLPSLALSPRLSVPLSVRPSPSLRPSVRPSLPPSVRPSVPPSVPLPLPSPVRPALPFSLHPSVPRDISIFASPLSPPSRFLQPQFATSLWGWACDTYNPLTYWVAWTVWNVQHLSPSSSLDFLQNSEKSTCRMIESHPLWFLFFYPETLWLHEFPPRAESQGKTLGPGASKPDLPNPGLRRNVPACVETDSLLEHPHCVRVYFYFYSCTLSAQNLRDTNCVLVPDELIMRLWIYPAQICFVCSINDHICQTPHLLSSLFCRPSLGHYPTISKQFGKWQVYINVLLCLAVIFSTWCLGLALGGAVVWERGVRK